VISKIIAMKAMEFSAFVDVEAVRVHVGAGA
jgi:hypothetical protein